MSMKMSDFRIDNAFTRLLLEEPLWSRVSRHISKVPTLSIPTAGVRISDDGRFEMMYNPNFFEMLEENIGNREKDDRFSILQHELFHIVLDHVLNERMEGLSHQIKNVAFDLAINSHISNLGTFHERYVRNPDGVCVRIKDAEKGAQPMMLCVPGVGDFKDFPAGLIAEEYAELLKKKMCEKCGQPKDQPKSSKGNKPEKNKGKGKKDKSENGEKSEEKTESSGEQGQPSESGENGESGEGQGQCEHGSCSGCGKPQKGGGSGGGAGGVIDDHNWDNATDEAKQIARERMREVLREAMNEINSNSLGWGNTPANIKESIIKFVNGTIDWKKVLAYFVQSSVKIDRRNSIKKINKRFPYIHAGRTQNRTANIAISIDQSGSVGDDMLEAFFGELNKLATLVTFTVIPFDCSVEESLIEVWKKGQRQVAKRVKHGGTDFDAPTKYVNEAGIFDAHIILTDMQAPKPIPSRVPRMWMTTEDCMKHLPFATNERIIPITIKK